MDKITDSQLKNLAASLSSGMFSTRESLGEASKYVTELAEASGKDGIIIWTAVGVMLNTIANELNKIIKQDGSGYTIRETVTGELFYGDRGVGMVGVVEDIQRDVWGKIICIHWADGQHAKFYENAIKK